MALVIESSCINCGCCEPECPTQAIYKPGNRLVINSTKCTECVGHFESPQCVDFCHVQCIKPDVNHIENEEQLMIKFATLTGLIAPSV